VDAKHDAQRDVDEDNEKFISNLTAAMKRIPTACRANPRKPMIGLEAAATESQEKAPEGAGCTKQLNWQESLRDFRKMKPSTPSLTLPTSPELHTARRRTRGRSTERDRGDHRNSDPHQGARHAHHVDSTLPCTVPQGPHLRTPSRSRRPLGVSNSVTEFDRPRTIRPWKPELTVPVAPHLLTEMRSHVPRSRGSSADSMRSRSQDNTPQSSVRRPARSQSARCTPRGGGGSAQSREGSRQRLGVTRNLGDARSGGCRLDFGSDPVCGSNVTAAAAAAPSGKSMTEAAECARHMAHEAFDADCDGTKHLLVFGKDVPQCLPREQ